MASGRLSIINFLCLQTGISQIPPEILALEQQSPGQNHLTTSSLSLPSLNQSEEDMTIDFTTLPEEGRALNQLLINFLQTFNHDASFQGRQCAVCLNDKAGRIRHSCGHGNVCFACVCRLVFQSSQSEWPYECPVCREVVIELQIIYL